MFGAVVAAVCSVASAAFSVAKVVGSIGLAIQGIKMIVNAVVSVCKELGLIKEETEPEELGDKAIQAEEEGIVPEKFDTYEEYVKAVEEFEVDPEKSKTISEEAKQLKAAELASGLMMEKIPGLKPEILTTVMQMPGLSPEKISAVLSLLKDGKADGVNNVVSVLTNSTKDMKTYSEGLNNLVSIEKSMDPSIDDKQAQKNAMETIRNAQRG